MSSTLISLLVIVGVILLIGLMNSSTKGAGEPRRLTGFEPIESIQMKSEKGIEVFNSY